MSPACTHPVAVSTSNPAISGLSPHDRSLFCKFASGPSKTPDFPTVIAAIEHNARVQPDQVAAEVVGPDGALQDHLRITYGDLDRQATNLAASLRRLGVSNGDSVGLFVQRSIDMLVGIVATLKVGASYIPQHVGVAPPKQLRHVVEASGASVVLTLSQFEHALPAFPENVAVLPIDKAMRLPNVEPHSVPPLARDIVPDDVCYTIFTSGTTGAPKGVQVTHGNVANVLMTAPMNLGMAPGVRVSQILSVSFDMGAWEMLGSLCNGATLVIRHKSIAAAVKHVDVVIATPTVLGTLDTAHMTHIRTAAVAGEPCPRPLADAWGGFCTFYNACGPTETTIVNTAKRHTPDARVLTIGAPTPNNTVYVLDPVDRTPCAIGDVGEMWAGGRCVSAGYLGRADLTAERYPYDPFVDDGRSTMYKTGDLGRWTEDGELEHFGRVDDQVKIKGFRVELDGVSATVERAGSVEKAVALKIGDGIVAFVTPASADVEDARAAVAAKLPYYCVPTDVVVLPEFPRTGNGKVDKKELRGLFAADGSCGMSSALSSATSSGVTSRTTSGMSSPQKMSIDVSAMKSVKDVLTAALSPAAMGRRNSRRGSGRGDSVGFGAHSKVARATGVVEQGSGVSSVAVSDSEQ